MMNGRFHSLPVIDDAGDIVGSIASTDLIKYLNGQY